MRAAADRGAVIDAIKLLRQRQGLDLKDARDAVDGYLAANPQFREQFQAAAYRRSRPLRTALKLGLLLLAVGFVLRWLGK